MNDARNDPADGPTGSGARGAEIEELLAAVIEQPREEWESALQAAGRDRPDLAELLRRRFAALRDVGLLDQLAAAGASRSTDAGGDLEGAHFGDFLVGEELGGGAMGVVRRARQLSLDRDVALKLIRPEFALFPNARVRFEREAEAIARLRHDSIAQVHAAGTLDGIAFIAMELVEGEDVSAALARLRGRAPESLTGADLGAAYGDLDWEAAVLTVAIALARALGHAHARGVLHRDVKPSNVRLERDARRAVLVDFGLHTLSDAEDAGEHHQRDRLTRTGAAPGTLLYMAPEQLERGRTSERSEIYALGATLYEMLALQPPFEGESRSATERRIRAGDPDSIRARNRSIQPDLEAVVMKALRRDAADRYASMEAFADDLERAREGRPVRARRAGRLYRVRRFCRREPRLAAAVAAVTAFAIGTPTTFWSLERAHADDLTRAFDVERDAKIAAQDLALFALDVLDTTDPNVSAAPGPARDMLESALDRVSARLDDHPVYRALAVTPLAHIQTTLGMTESADELLREAITTLESALLQSDGRDEALVRSGLMEARARRCELLEFMGEREALVEERRRLRDDLAAFQGEAWWRVRLADANLAAEEDDLRDPPRTTAEGSERLAAIEGAFRETEALFLEQAPDDHVLDLAHLRARLGGVLLQRIRSIPGEVFEETATRALGDLERALDGFDAAGHRHTIRRAEAASSAGLAAKYAGDLELAETRYEEASATFEARLPASDHRRGGVLVNLSGLADQRGDLDRAIELLEEGLACLEQAVDDRNVLRVTAEGNLLGSLFRAQRFDGLRQRYEDFVDRQADAFGRRTPYVFASLENLALLCALEGDRANAIEHLRESVEIRRQLRGPDAPGVKRAEGWLRSLEEAAEAAGGD